MIERKLEDAARLGTPGVSRSAQHILSHRDAMWRFVADRRVEPTNNHAERELRHLVCWRKVCGGSQSKRGSRFAANLASSSRPVASVVNESWPSSRRRFRPRYAALCRRSCHLRRSPPRERVRFRHSRAGLQLNLQQHSSDEARERRSGEMCPATVVPYYAVAECQRRRFLIVVSSPAAPLHIDRTTSRKSSSMSAWTL